MPPHRPDGDGDVRPDEPHGRSSTVTVDEGSPGRSTRRRVGRLLAAVRSDHTLGQKASLNMLASVLDYCARLGMGLIVTPILVSRLGDLVFGVYQVLVRLIGYATPAGGRPSQALKWTIAHDQHSTEYEGKRRQVGSAIAVWFAFLPLLLVLGGTLAWFAPTLLGAPDSLDLTIRVAAAILVADLVLTNLATIPQSVVQGENLGYKRMGLSALVVLGGGCLTIAVVVLGGGLVAVTASLVATTVVTGLLFWWVARRNVAWFGVSRPALGAIWSFARLSGWFLLWNLVMQVMRGSDVVVLGIADSPEAVTVYTLSRYVPEAIFGVVAIVIAAIMPGLGGLVGARDYRRVLDVRSESMAVTWLIATAAGAAFLFWQESFLALWVGPEYYPGRAASLLIVLMVFQFAFIRNDANIIDLTLNLRAKVVLGVVSAALAVVLAIVFVGPWGLGITGMALAFLLGRSILSVSYPLLVSRFLGSPLRTQARGAVRPLAVAALMYSAAVAAAPSVEAASWLGLVVLGGGSTAALFTASFFLGLSASQRRRVATRLRRLASPR